MHYGDITDGSCILRYLLEIEPDEIYNLAAQSHVRVSFDKPIYTHQVNADGVLNVLEAVRVLNARKPVRIYQASSSEMFGGLPDTVPQSEATVYHPRSPYACAKVSAYHYVVQYRESHGIFGCNGILFNHESPHRGETFVTRKITLAAARIKEGLQSEIVLGNLDAKRDWGFAGDYVEAMWLMLQQDEPDDFVIATGETRSVREFLECAFSAVDLDWNDYIRIDPQYFRPTEVDVLRGDASKAKRVLGWQPRCSFSQLVELMMKHDVRQAQRERLLKDFDQQSGSADDGSAVAANNV
jgi:GDPmannose 4,6-dehydratase